MVRALVGDSTMIAFLAMVTPLYGSNDTLTLQTDIIPAACGRD